MANPTTSYITVYNETTTPNDQPYDNHTNSNINNNNTNNIPKMIIIARANAKTSTVFPTLPIKQQQRGHQ